MKLLLDLAASSLLGAALVVAPTHLVPESEADLLSPSPASSTAIEVSPGDAAPTPADVAGLSEVLDGEWSGRTLPQAFGSQLPLGPEFRFGPQLRIGPSLQFGADREPGAEAWTAFADASDGDQVCVPDDLWPLWFDFDPCPDGFTVYNFTECTYYIRVFYDCNGDGLCDGWDEYFIMDTQDGEKPWKWKHWPDPGCTIIGWGIFDVLPWGGCSPEILRFGCEYWIG